MVPVGRLEPGAAAGLQAEHLSVEQECPQWCPAAADVSPLCSRDSESAALLSATYTM